MSTTNAARERVEKLLDDYSFVELGAAVTARSTEFNIKEIDTPSDGVITGYGLINGSLVYVYSQDASVLGGSIGEMHAKKIVNIYEMALKMGAPVIGIIDSVGLRLQESVDGLDAFGKIFQSQAMVSGVIPQISVIYGQCGGGLSVIAKLSDIVLMESEDAKLFVNSPNTIDGNKTLDTASTEYQSKHGNVDIVASDDDLMAKARDIISILPSNNDDEAMDYESQDDLNRASEGIEGSAPSEALKVIADDGFLIEMKKDYAPCMFTGFIKLNGATVGVFANNKDKVCANGFKKAADFVKLCDAFEIPILTLTDIEGFEESETTESYSMDSVSKLVYSLANATVPKVNVITGNAVGTAGIVMNSKSLGADIVYAWPNASVSMMDSDKAVKIMYSDEIAKGEDVSQITAEYNALQANIEKAASRGYVDTIINPVDTRKYIIGAFEMLYSKYEGTFEKKHGTK